MHNPQNFNIKYVYFALLILLLLSAGANGAPLISERDKIQHLLEFVEASNATFIRNGTEHSSKEAREHLELKLKRSRGQIQTAEQFIDLLATKSLITGKPYLVKLPNGDITEAGRWLHQELENEIKENSK